MKYITFAVPCYNSENYMRRCVDSLLIGGKDVEIILIDDGSSDRTAQIADEYEIEYPDIVRVLLNVILVVVIAGIMLMPNIMLRCALFLKSCLLK